MDENNNNINECQICAEKFTKSIRKPIECQFCKFVCCKNCIQTQITTQYKDPACMNPGCDKRFTREFMSENFSKNFLEKDFRNHREETLFIREQSLFPETMQHIERDIMSEKLDDEVEEIENTIMDLRNTIANLRNEARIRRHQSFNIRNGGSIDDKKDKRKFIKKCPNEGCEGFLSSRWKCAICGTNVCSECHAVKNPDEEHVCKKEDIESAKLISKECKNCPKCGIEIYKIEGCDQMWCTQCFTAFSWKTGEVVTGVIHNPHYFQYMANNGDLQRQPGDLICGGAPGTYDINRFIYSLNEIDTVKLDKFRRKILNISRFLTHCEMIEIPNLQLNLTEINLNLRKMFIRKMITLENFKQQLGRREKENNRKTELRHVFETFTQAGGDIIRNLIRSNYLDVTEKDLDNCYKEIEGLCNFCNKAFSNICKIYSIKTYRLNVVNCTISRI